MHKERESGLLKLKGCVCTHTQWRGEEGREGGGVTQEVCNYTSLDTNGC